MKLTTVVGERRILARAIVNRIGVHSNRVAFLEQGHFVFLWPLQSFFSFSAVILRMTQQPSCTQPTDPSSYNSHSNRRGGAHSNWYLSGFFEAFVRSLLRTREREGRTESDFAFHSSSSSQIMIPSLYRTGSLTSKR